MGLRFGGPLGLAINTGSKPHRVVRCPNLVVTTVANGSTSSWWDS